MRQGVKRDYGGLLMWSAVLVSMPRWAGAFIAADAVVIPLVVDELLHVLNLVSGVGMGAIEVLGAAYLLDAWGRMKPRRTWNAKHLDHRWLVLTGFVVGLFVLMPLILAPYIFVRMNGLGLAGLPGWFQWVWSGAVVLSPAFIVGGVAVAREGLVASGGSASTGSASGSIGSGAGSEPALSEGSGNRAGSKRVESGVVCPKCGNGFGSQAAVNAHQQWCAGRERVESNGHVVEEGEINN